MSDMNIIVATAEGRRLYSALEAGIAWAALGKTVRIFLQGEAAALLRAPIGHAGDDARRAAGQPDLAWIVSEAGEMDIKIAVCQSGLALVGMTLADIDPDVERMVQATGLIGYLADIAPGEPVLVF